jgi:hypothetical protein
LVPSEHSSGQTIRRGPITKSGNLLARTCLVEAAWTYRFPARVSRLIRDRSAHLPEPIRATAWKAQVRLTRRYRQLMAAGKVAPKVVTAIARELLGFIWAIAPHGRAQDRLSTWTAQRPQEGSRTEACTNHFGAHGRRRAGKVWRTLVPGSMPVT